MALPEARHFFDAPIPGQSLTQAPGSSPTQQPPQFVDPEEAAENIWGGLRNVKSAMQVGKLLEVGTPVEVIANTLLFAGFSQGKWTPDIMMLLMKPVMYMVAAIGKKQGIPEEDIVLFKPDRKAAAFLIAMDEIKAEQLASGDFIAGGAQEFGGIQDIFENAEPIKTTPSGIQSGMLATGVPIPQDKPETPLPQTLREKELQEALELEREIEKTGGEATLEDIEDAEKLEEKRKKEEEEEFFLKRRGGR